jgi:hypothetical protein
MDFPSRTGTRGFLIDPATGRVTVIAGNGCSVDARVGLILVFGRNCPGLTAREPSGRRRFRLFAEGPPVWELERARRYAYVRPFDGTHPDAPRKSLHVVDLERGAVVGRLEVGKSTTVIPE